MAKTIVESIEIDASAASVVNLVRDQAGHAAWFPGMEQVTKVGDEEYSPLHERTENPSLPIWCHRFAYTRLHIVATDLDSQTIRWRVADSRGHIACEWTFQFTALNGGKRTQVTLTERRLRESWSSRIWAWCMRIKPGHCQRKYLHALQTRAEQLGKKT